jgi:DnaJ-domain-containing protein 1
MGIFDFNENDENIDDNYDPYKPTIYFCKRGIRFNKYLDYCCNACFQDQKTQRIYNRFNNTNNYKIIIEEHAYELDDDYKTLKLIPPKTFTEIKKQYRKLALKYHPDKPCGNHDKFIKIKDSYNRIIASF